MVNLYVNAVGPNNQNIQQFNHAWSQAPGHVPLIDGPDGEAKLSRPGQGQTLFEGHAALLFQQRTKTFQGVNCLGKHIRKLMLADLGTTKNVSPASTGFSTIAPLQAYQVSMTLCS